MSRPAGGFFAMTPSGAPRRCSGGWLAPAGIQPCPNGVAQCLSATSRRMCLKMLRTPWASPSLPLPSIARLPTSASAWTPRRPSHRTRWPSLSCRERTATGGFPLSSRCARTISPGCNTMRKSHDVQDSNAFVAVRDRARARFREAPVEALPLFAPFITGKLAPEQALRVAQEMHAVVEAFPRFLAALLANDLDSELRDTIVDNLYEEQGRMDKTAVHLTTYRALLAMLGDAAPHIRIGRPCVGVVAYVRAVLDLCARGPVAEGAAALAIIEDHVARASLVIGRWIAREHPTARDR